MLQSGEVIAFPTDTIWGLVAHPDYLDNLLHAKWREDSKPTQRLFSSIEKANKFVQLPEVGKNLLTKFGGKIMLICNEPDGGATIGFRVPDESDVKNLLENFDYLHSSSANLSGGDPCRNLEEVMEHFPNLNCYESEFTNKNQSTIIDLTQPTPKLIREGLVSFSDVKI